MEDSLAIDGGSLVRKPVNEVLGPAAGYTRDQFAGRLRRKIVRSLPVLSLLAVVAGVANIFVIFAVTVALAGADLEQQADRFLIFAVLYILARKAVEKRLILLTAEVVYDTRAALLREVLNQPFDQFEKTERGSIYTALCEDTITLGNTIGSVATLVTSVVTTGAAFVYLAFTHPPLAMLMGVVVGLISYAYARSCAHAKQFAIGARQSWNLFVHKVGEALDGFKELSLHFTKRREFHVAAQRKCHSARVEAEVAKLSQVDAFMFGEMLLLVAIGIATFVGAQFVDLDPRQRSGFVIVLLYLIGPVKTILAAIPLLVETHLAWSRIMALLGNETAAIASTTPPPLSTVNRLELHGLSFQYESPNGDGMRVGPIDLTISRGECLFLTGGNGSGKTTLAKLVTGLYGAQAGELRIDGRLLSRAEAGEYFSVIFSPCFVFDQLYGARMTPDAIGRTMDRLGLSGRVQRKNGWVDITRLSNGQRKRVALLESFLQDRPILLFDEVTADQDSEFRRLFYEQIIGELKRAGKIVIVITHDEQYFHVADNILKLDLGRELPLHPLAGPARGMPGRTLVPVWQPGEKGAGAITP